MAMPSLTKKSARDRKDPRSAEAFAKLRHETNALRPKQVTVETVLEVGNSKVVQIIGPFRE